MALPLFLLGSLQSPLSSYTERIIISAACTYQGSRGPALRSALFTDERLESSREALC